MRGAAAVAIAVLLAAAPLPLWAQRVVIGAQGAMGDYREVSGALHYRGSGFVATGLLRVRKWSADVEVTRLSYDPADQATATQSFTATEVDVYVRYIVAPSVSLEVGALHRSMNPETAAQSVGAIRLGVQGSYVIQPGAVLGVRGNYLAGSKFSGGGTAPFAMDVGLSLSVGAGDGRYRLTGDYDFQTFHRKTSSAVPIQQAVARVGLAFGF